MTNEKDEWGNISLPGLSDEELYKTNWNKVAHAHTKINNPEFSNVMKRKFKEIKVTQEYQENYNKGMSKRDNTYQAVNNSRNDVREKISNSLKGYQKSQEHLDKVAEQNRLRSKAICTPYGNFESRKLAVEYLSSTGLINAGKKLDKWLKTKPTEYYYLDK